ncbi:hypothetical protein [Bradyrhizobium sp. AUGA SZCCT0176]|nr:hypothetical protein [Bradyrhizobium sp. AUGA SZCCT0176]
MLQAVFALKIDIRSKLATYHMQIEQTSSVATIAARLAQNLVEK